VSESSPVEMNPSTVEISPFCVLGGISKSKDGNITEALSDLINWRFKSFSLVQINS
jgi:hypothetical protein